MTDWLLPVEAGLVRPDLAVEVISPPYDLLTGQERAAYAARVPRSFLNGTPSSESADPEEDAAQRREMASRYMSARLAESAWRSMPAAFFIYRIRSDGHTQTGVVGDVPATAFPSVVRPHEDTRPTRVADLVDYLDRVSFGSSPVGLTYRRVPEIDEVVQTLTTEEPDLDVVLEDGDHHTVWAVTDAGPRSSLATALTAIEASYIIDGHHRVKATLARGHDPATPGGRFLAVAFPDSDLAVYPFHRWLATDWRPDGASDGKGLQASPGKTVAVAREGEWEIDLGGTSDDTSALAQRVLGPFLGVSDERVDHRVVFVPGYPGPEALRSRVASRGGVGFLLHPPSIAS
ncbi:MAG TPA: DUF1015 family protein, partial [Acidimicrobiia bacterium]|nr:DUF1015 family protein [Acidimicrobiia bacterium]